VSGGIPAIEVPNPIGPIADGLGGIAGWGARRAAGAMLGPVGDAIARGLANACDKIGREVLGFLDASSSVHFDTGWWASPRGARLVGVILGLSLVFMLGFLLLALLQGMLAGDPGGMLRTALVELPLSIAATALLATVTGVLLALTDEASNAVLAGVPGDLGRFFGGFGTAASVVTHGFAGMIMLVLFLVGALLVWVELVVRSSLIYWLVAAAPLFAAARVWPVARGAWRKLVEIGCVLIFAKLAIALALALGAAALAGGGPKEGDLGTQVGTDLGGLLAGAALMLLASFTPFVLLRLLPIVEAAVVAQGISRSPARASMTVMQMGYYAAGLERMASGPRRTPAAGGEAPGGGPPPAGGGPGPGGAGGPPGDRARPGGPRPGHGGAASADGRRAPTARAGTPAPGGNGGAASVPVGAAPAVVDPAPGGRARAAAPSPGAGGPLGGRERGRRR
jgi:hypothetical protein